MRFRGLDSVIRNYFSDLELHIDASLEEIQKAYRRLARRFHPDLNPLDVQAEESFHRIQEAFEFLSSPNRAEKLRQQLVPLELKKATQRWGNYPMVPESTEQFIDEWTEEPSINRRFKRPAEELDIWAMVEVSKLDLFATLKKKILLKVYKPCPQCRGLGGRAKSAHATCKRCGGLGNFLIERGAMHWRKTCDSCAGKGYTVSTPCLNCDGRGKVLEDEWVEIRIPSKADLKKPLQFKNWGHYSFSGKQRGDLWVQLIQKN